MAGNVADYFKQDGSEGSSGKPSQRSQDYKCVLNSKASEESLVRNCMWNMLNHVEYALRYNIYIYIYKFAVVNAEHVNN